MTVRNYRELVVWQKSMTAVQLLYEQVKKLPPSELYALSDQMRRCAVSIPSNIAEGQQRNGGAEFARFITYAQGLRAELETQLMICVMIGYLKEDDISELMQVLEENNKMLSSLLKTLPVH